MIRSCSVLWRNVARSTTQERPKARSRSVMAIASKAATMTRRQPREALRQLIGRVGEWCKNVTTSGQKSGTNGPFAYISGASPLLQLAALKFKTQPVVPCTAISGKDH
jgi:hypothetical protein